MNIDQLPHDNWHLETIAEQMGLSQSEALLRLLNHFQTLNAVATHFNTSTSVLDYHVRRHGVVYRRGWYHAPQGDEDKHIKRRELNPLEGGGNG